MAHQGKSDKKRKSHRQSSGSTSGSSNGRITTEEAEAEYKRADDLMRAYEGHIKKIQTAIELWGDAKKVPSNWDKTVELAEKYSNELTSALKSADDADDPGEKEVNAVREQSSHLESIVKSANRTVNEWQEKIEQANKEIAKLKAEEKVATERYFQCVIIRQRMLSLCEGCRKATYK